MVRSIYAHTTKYLLIVLSSSLVLLAGFKLYYRMHDMAPSYWAPGALAQIPKFAVAQAQTTPLVEIGPEVSKEPVSDQTAPHLSPSERKLLEALSQKNIDLQKKEQSILLREAAFEAIYTKLDQKIKSLEALNQKTGALVAQLKNNQDEQTARLIKIYEKMKPENAAPIFDQLDIKIVLNVLMGMQEAKTAAILSQMKPEKARAITLALSQKIVTTTDSTQLTSFPSEKLAP